MCNDDCCQRYQGTTFISPRSIEAARNTAGQVLVYSDQVIDARYSKNCGGVVEDYASVWGGESVPYLVPLWDSPVLGPRPAHFGTFEDYFEFTDAFCAPPRFAGVDLQSMLGKVDVSGTYYRWHHEVMAGTITCNLRQYEDVDWIAVEGVEILHRGASARITAISLKGVDHTGSRAEHTVLSEYSIRRVFSDSFLYSSAFEILNAETFREDGVLRLRGCGWGHGVGLCQMGALGMALSGYAAKEILEHYYPGAALRTLDAVLGTN